MASDLQRVVDSLGARLERAVAIDDPSLRLQAYSPHYGPVDEIRLDSILHRQAPAGATAWVMTLGLSKADKPTRIPANPELGMHSRVCVPIRWNRALLGYLFLIDSDESLDEDALAVAQEAADHAAVIMHRERLVVELEHSKEREHLRDLLSDDQTIRGRAAAALVEADLFVPGTRTGAVVVRPLHLRGELADENVQLTTEEALSRARRSLTPRHGLQLARPDHGVLVIALDRKGDTKVLEETAEALRLDLLRGLGDDWRVVAGIGDVQPLLAEAAVSYEQALQAARVAEIVRSFDDQASWPRVGIYRTLAQLPADALRKEALHPGFLNLLDSETAPHLIRTLECYLDHAGDAQATAAELAIHRTSLYYRLHRIEDVAGISLSDGDDRLAMHLGLKMARLAGIYPRPDAGA